jgi:hypothetical protein
MNLDDWQLHAWLCCLSCLARVVEWDDLAAQLIG